MVDVIIFCTSSKSCCLNYGLVSNLNTIWKRRWFYRWLGAVSFIFIPILGFGDAQYKGANPMGGNDDILDDVLEN